MSELGFTRRLPRLEVCGDRDAYLIEMSRGKRVLHLGCADAEIVEGRISQGELLHSKIARVAGECVGVDLDEGGVAALRALGLADIYRGNAECLSEVAELSDRRFDVILAGEVIEHLANPGQMLGEARVFLAEGGVLVLTTPNSLAWANFAAGFLSTELVHPAHTMIFSPTMLTNLCARTGWRVCNLSVYVGRGHVNRNRGNACARHLRRTLARFDGLANRCVAARWPLMSDGLILEARAS